MFRLEKKVAVVTGGGSGIGRAIAQVFAQQGAFVFVLDINQSDAQETIHSIKEQKGQSRFIHCDVSDQGSVAIALQEIEHSSKTIDLLINNAGIAHIGNVENTNAVDFEKLLAVNVSGVYHMIQATLPMMKAQGGSIINLASVAASVGLNDRFAYSTTKGAIKTMTLSVAKDLLPYNIRCNSISPGRVHTPFVDGFLKKNYPGKEAEMFEKLAKTQPIGRMATPYEIACLALYLCSDEASFLTGTDYAIDGGFITLNT